MLSLDDVTVRYGDTAAVDDVSLELATGQVLAVLGPSGCGKSTLLRAVAGLEPLTAGSIAWDGVDLAGTPTHKRGFALMFQDGQLFGHLTVARNVGYALRLRRTPNAAARVRELLALTGSPVVRLNRAVAVGEADGARAGLAALAEVDPALPRHRAVSAYLHEKDGDLATAARLYSEAAALATSAAEKTHLTKQAARLHRR